MEKERERMTEAAKALLNSLYNLTFANPLVIAISHLEGKNIFYAEDTYPEIFENSSVRSVLNSFLQSDEKGFLNLNSLGRVLIDFRDRALHLLDNEDLVKRLNERLNLQLSNPAKDYVYAALDQLDERERLCLRIVAARPYLASSFKEVNSYLEPFGEQVEEEEFKKMIQKFRNLLLSHRADVLSIPEVFKRHIIERTSYLEEGVEKYIPKEERKNKTIGEIVEELRRRKSYGSTG